MPSRPHSPAFLAARLALLALEDADRRPIARLFGAMHVPEADLTPSAIDLLRTIADLDDADLLRLGRWFRRYVNRWGGVPSAAGHLSTAALIAARNAEPLLRHISQRRLAWQAGRHDR